MIELTSRPLGAGSVLTPAGSAGIEGRGLEAVNEGGTHVVGHPGLQALDVDRLELLAVVGASLMTDVDDDRDPKVATEHARDVLLRGVSRNLAVQRKIVAAQQVVADQGHQIEVGLLEVVINVSGQVLMTVQPAVSADQRSVTRRRMTLSQNPRSRPR